MTSKCTDAHKWEKTGYEKLLCGCSDWVWQCQRCGKIMHTPSFRGWYCSNHGGKSNP